MTQKELTLLNLGDSLDNISNIDPRGYGVCHILYPASREYTGGPLCMNAAGKLCDTLKQDDLVYIMTGFVLPPFARYRVRRKARYRLPGGECPRRQGYGGSCRTSSL